MAMPSIFKYDYNLRMLQNFILDQSLNKYHALLAQVESLSLCLLCLHLDQNIYAKLLATFLSRSLFTFMYFEYP